MKKSVIRTVVTVLLLFLTVAGGAGLAGVLSLNGLMDPARLSETARASGWIEGVRERIRRDFAPLNDVSGVSEDVTNAFLEETLSDDICMQFWSAVPVDFPTEALTEDLVARIRLYAEELKARGEIDVSEEEWEELVANLPETAFNFISVVRRDVLLNGIGAYKTSFTDYWKKAFPLIISFCAVVFAGSVAVLCFIRKKKWLWVGYAAFTGIGLTLLAPVTWLRAEGFASRLQISPAYVKSFLIRMYDLVCTRVTVTGGVFAGVGLLCGAIALIVALRARKTAKQGGEEIDPQLQG